jgi:hypothetical protein
MLPLIAGALAPGAFGAALTAPVVAGGLGALGTGLAAGASLAGAGGLAGLFGIGGAGAVAPGAFGALAPAVAAKLAPAAAAQAAGTIGTAVGSVAPGAFGANLAGSAAPGLAGTLGGGVAPGAFGANLTGAGQGLAGAANQTLAQQMAQHQATTNLARQQLLAQSGTKDVVGMGLQKTATPSPFDPSTGLRTGLDPRFAGQQSLQASTGPTVDPTSIMGRSIRPDQNFMQNLGNIGSFQDVKDYADQHPYATSAMAGLGAMGISKMMEPKKVPTPEDKSMIRPYTYERTQRPEAYAVSPSQDSSERLYFNDQFTAGEPYKAAEGGIASAYAMGGPVEQMAAMNAVGANTGYPQAGLQTPMYSNPAMQRPQATNVISPSADAGVDTYTGEARFAGGGETQYGRPVLGTNPGHVNPENQTRAELAGGSRSTAPTAPLPVYSYDPKTMQFTQTKGGNSVTGGIATPAMGPMQAQRSATPINVPAYQTPEQQLNLNDFYTMMDQRLAGYGGYARGGNVGGEANLGGYSDGGRLLKGPGDGVSDSIPAVIGNKQPARLADGEFVIPARIVSELGNGSTEAGARKLYAMMERVQSTRKKSIGKKKVAVNSKADKHLPA